MIKDTLIEEPNLYFGNNGQNIDPKIGLINFGCYGKFTKGETQPLIIKAGFIGTQKSKQLLESWLEKLKYRINGKINEKSNNRDVDFPGISLDSPLKFEIKLDNSCCQYIDESIINNLVNLNRKERVLKLVETYDQKFKDLAETTDPHPEIVLIPLSEKAVELCKEPNLVGDKIVYERRNVKPRLGEEFPVFDFHNIMKVIAYKNGGMASQIIRPSTLDFNNSVQDPATIGWNFAVATYYKATGIPWKLSELDDSTCYVGLSFYLELSKDNVNMRTSMAHVYLRSGESQVIRGKPFKWDNTNGKTPSLSEFLAIDIINDVLALYKRQKGTLPKRVVIHKVSPFTSEEIRGFDSALKNVELADYIHINENNKIKFFPKSQQYPALRGTFIYEGTKFLLYTTGYVPLLGSYYGHSVPAPLFLEAYRLNSTPGQIAKDILALTKLDWNNSAFNTRLPVTISVSRKVGEILSESSARKIDPPSSYRFYM